MATKHRAPRPVEFVPCIEKVLPPQQWIDAAKYAVEQNPANDVQRGQMYCAFEAGVEELVLTPAHLALLTQKYWGSGGVNLTVGFPFDSPAAALKSRILSHMNAWGSRANVTFVLSSTDPQVRIALTPGSGYWSYLGTDVRFIAKGEPTMNLERFTMSTPESEFVRVVRHETGHTLGFPHEHLRKAIVQRLDPQKTITYFQQTQGWNATMTRQQVLTPINEADLIASPADQTSIMCYQLPGSITIDGKPIVGGTDINEADYALASQAYPKELPPPPPPPTAPTLRQAQDAVTVALAKVWGGVA